MTISIITATYNSAATVADTLASIAAQDYQPNVEHIIIDGASKDNTLDIVKQYPHVSKVVSERDRGLYDAMNKGIALATGDIIGILNSDDYYAHNSVLSRVAQQLEQTGADTLYGDLEYVDPQNTSQVVRRWRAGGYVADSFYRGWMPPHPTFFVRKEVYERCGKFNLDLRFSADYELILRMLLRYGASASYLPETLVKMRTGGLSNASLKNRLRANKEDRLAWEINNLQPKFYTVYWKPVSKIFQYI